MVYSDMPVIILLLATGYLLTIYLLLTLAQRTIKDSPYIANSISDAYASVVSTEVTTGTEDVERWSRLLNGATSLAHSSTSKKAAKRDTVGLKELQSELRSSVPLAQPIDIQEHS